MPMPTPSAGESRDDFVSRCMENDTMVDDFPDTDQRYAVCQRQWEERGSRSNSKTDHVVGGYVEKAYEEKRLDDNGDEVPVGIVEGYLATWDVDRANDRFLQGAFEETIAEHQRRGRPMRLKRNHFGLIGGFDPDKLREDDTGLFGVAEVNLLVAEGREAYALAKQGVLTDFSVAVSSALEDVQSRDGVRTWKRVRLWETSLVDEPMNPKAVATVVRSADSEPIQYAPADTPWEPNAAMARLAEFDGDTTGAFLWRDSKPHLPVADVIDGAVQIVPDALYEAAAKLHTDPAVDPDDKPTHDDVVHGLNAMFSAAGLEAPTEKGTWSLLEIQHLRKSLRRAIISRNLLSRAAIDSVAGNVGLLRDGRAPEPEPLDESGARIDGMVNLLRGERQGNSEAENTSEAKAIQSLSLTLKGAWGNE